jgi:carbamoylphosphate synthase small subunit
MIKKNELCQKILEIYPEIGQCGVNLKVDFDKRQKAWVVSLKKDNHKLKHFLENPDAESCMEGKQCVALGIEIAQLMKNIKGQQF